MNSPCVKPLVTCRKIPRSKMQGSLNYRGMVVGLDDSNTRKVRMRLRAYVKSFDAIYTYGYLFPDILIQCNGLDKHSQTTTANRDMFLKSLKDNEDIPILKHHLEAMLGDQKMRWVEIYFAAGRSMGKTQLIADYSKAVALLNFMFNLNEVPSCQNPV